MSTKDQGEVTIISSSNDGYKIRWKITSSQAVEFQYNNTNYIHYGQNYYNIKNIESKPVRLWGYDWNFKLQGKCVNNDRNDNKATLKFEQMGHWFSNLFLPWAMVGKVKGLKTSSKLIATFKQVGYPGKSFNGEEGLTPDGGYEMFSLTNAEISRDFNMEFIWSIQLYLVPDTTQRFNSISGDFGKMLDDTKGHDITIRCEEVEMTAHKIILAGRSSVFQAMFQSDMKEAKESLVEINEVNPESIKAMLRWIYTCQIDDKYKNFVLDLIRLAHMYEMPLLMKECQAILISQIKKENVADILIVAEMVEAEELKKTAISFIIGDKSITKMDGFQEKVNKKLFVEIINAHNC